MSKSAWTASSSEAIAASLKTQVTGLYLSLDQTIPESVINGRPTFSEGLLFGTTPTVGAFAEGKVYYDPTKKTINLEVGTAETMSLGIQEFAYVNNPSGSPIAKGLMVYPTGGVANTPTVALAQADVESTSLILGMTYMAIPAGGDGLVLVRGVVDNLDTHLFLVGDTVYLDPAVPGGVTKVAPTTSEFLVRVGVVLLSHATTGSVYIRPIIKNRLADQADVTIITPATDQILRFNGLEWVNSAGIAASASKGVGFYYNGIEIIALGTNNENHVETLAKVPWSAVEVVEDTTVVNSTSPVLSDIYLYDTALGRTTLEAGAWIFSCYCAVNLAAGVSQFLHNVTRVRPGAGTVTVTNGADATHRIVTASTGTPFAAAMVDVGGTRDSDSYLRTPLGVYQITERTDNAHLIILVPSTYANESAVVFSVHKRLFQVTTGEVDNIATAPLYVGIQLYTINSVQPSYTILATDKLAIYRFAVTTSVVAKHLYFAYGGTLRYSRVDTPLATVHGDLAGLQGGAGATPAEEYYHLTSAEHLIAVTIATNSVPGYLSAADHTTFAAKESVLTFSSGLTRAANTITNDLSTGLAGGQSIYGGTLTTQGLTLQANKADATTGTVALKGLNATTPPILVTATTDVALGTEMITDIVDRDFSGAGNWGTGSATWSIVGGTWTHSAGANATSLPIVNMTAAPVIGDTYQIVVTVVTSTVGTLVISYGGVSAIAVGKTVGTRTAWTVDLTPTNTTSPLTATPSAAWVGSIDNISMKRITYATSVLSGYTAAAALGCEINVPNATSFGIGWRALKASLGVDSTAGGANCGYRNTTQNFTGFGFNAGLANTGSSFTGFGIRCGQSNVGENFVGFGGNCGLRNYGASFAGFGVNCGVDNVGSDFTGFGGGCGSGNTGDNFTGLGTNAGYHATYHSSPNCTFLGANTTVDADGYDNSSAVGSGATITASNRVQLGNASVTLVNTQTGYGIAGVKVVGAQVAAIGLDAQTDSQKITAIISCLRAHGLMGPNA